MTAWQAPRRACFTVQEELGYSHMPLAWGSASSDGDGGLCWRSDEAHAAGRRHTISRMSAANRWTKSPPSLSRSWLPSDASSSRPDVVPGLIPRHVGDRLTDISFVRPLGPTAVSSCSAPCKSSNSDLSSHVLQSQCSSDTFDNSGSENYANRNSD
jgi:hypothetical protein